MEINTSNLNNTLNTETAKTIAPGTTATTTDNQTPTQQSTDTVLFSAAAVALSKTDNKSTETGSDIDIQQQINQLQNNITQDPNQAIFAQAGKITDTVVKGLLG